MLAAILAAASISVAPRSAPPVFVSGVYALTFRTPKNTLICPLSPDWVGSDHGTVVFLSSPGSCAGAGYPSSSRGVAQDAPRLEIYYQYWLDDPATPPPACYHHKTGSVMFVGKRRRVCMSREGDKLRISVNGRYSAGQPAWVEVTLVTTARRLSGDIRALREVAASLRPCRSSWSDDKGRSGSYGTGKACPADGQFF
jgi:hypothetical protein